MAGFMLALTAVFLTSIGGRDQMLVAALSQKMERNTGLLVAGCCTSIITAIAMALAGNYIVSLMPPGNGRLMLVAIALAMASLELFWPLKADKFAEPTRSLGAISLVLLARQWMDSARFLIFAFAAWSGSIWLAAAGGAFGGLAAIAIGWIMAGELLEQWPLRPVRLALAVVTIGIAAYVGLSARGLLG